ncbi:Multidrug resistance protein MdtA precursor [Roseovarius albus]|uniref:Multidrug resistance protein MdtA n=1 Tax=Roseovarius albus TaxID=1247867 RepID=A0A1X6Z1B8_9RHOB|nr:efflux RND transporter periplasmic adaptor subunit [Roseovarius albus]SLN37465.1 Multidrug resistance protein MdtA precursor [Roseovarius albus]
MTVWKQLLIVCLLAAAGYGGFTYYQHYTTSDEDESTERPARPILVETAHVESQMMVQSVEAVGTTRALRSISIVPLVSGRIVSLEISPGQAVEVGDVLAQLDDRIAQADLAEAQARLTEQEQVLTRVRQLRETNAVSQASLDEVTARLAEANAQLDRMEQQLEDRTIRAPFSGVIGLNEIDLGARVDEGETLTRLDDLSQVIIEFSLPETLFAEIAIGQPISARSAAFPGRAFAGTVSAIDTRIDPTSRAFRARAIVPNPDGTLPAGMFMSLTLILSESENLVVPEEAIVFEAASTYVFVIVDDVAERRNVTTGQRQSAIVAINDGLQSGDEVVIRGLKRVRDGSQINRPDPTSETDQTVENGS